jgi:hypothetical protein
MHLRMDKLSVQSGTAAVVQLVRSEWLPALYCPDNFGNERHIMWVELCDDYR